jgi:hypothetical protein
MTKVFDLSRVNKAEKNNDYCVQLGDDELTIMVPVSYSQKNIKSFLLKSITGHLSRLTKKGLWKRDDADQSSVKEVVNQLVAS